MQTLGLILGDLLQDFVESKKMELNNFLNMDEIKTDDLGRVVIDDRDILEKINSTMLTRAEFVLPDGACGNSHCLC